METLKTLAFVLCLPLAAAVGLLLLAGKGDGVFEEAAIVRLGHPPELVYEWLSEPRYRERWIQGLERSRLDGSEIEAGARLDESVRDEVGALQRSVEVVAAEYGELLALRVHEDDRVVTVRYALSKHQSSKRTRVDLTVSGELEGLWPRLIEPFLAADVLEEAELELAGLDEALRDA